MYIKGVVDTVACFAGHKSTNLTTFVTVSVLKVAVALGQYLPISIQHMITSPFGSLLVVASAASLVAQPSVVQRLCSDGNSENLSKKNWYT